MSLKVNDRLTLRRITGDYGDTQTIEETLYIVVEASDKGNYRQEVILMKAGIQDRGRY